MLYNENVIVPPMKKLLLLLALLLIGCSSVQKLEVKSTFSDGGKIPKVYTLDGKDLSPPLEFPNLNPKAKSIAIIVIDPDAHDFVHWLIWDIPPVKRIPEGIPHGHEIFEPFHAYQGKNDFGRYGYDGPYPPKGQTHRYVFKVYVLDTVLNLKNATMQELMNAMRGHVIQYGEIVGIYRR